MGQPDYKKFKHQLLKLKKQLLNSSYTDELKINSDELSDDADYASNMLNAQLAFSLQERDLYKLRLVEKSLHKIDEGTYGECEDCGEKISHKRLEKQPWAQLCLEHAEEHEEHSRREQFRKVG